MRRHLSALRFVRIHGQRIGCRVAGHPRHPPVVLLHALASHSESSNEVAGALAAQGFWIIAPDLRGHGGSDRSDDYALERFEQDLIELFDELGLAYFDLIGHSLGGHLALRVAARIPHPIRRIVLEAAPVPPRNVDDLASMQVLSSQPWWWRGLRMLGSSRLLKRVVLRQFDFRAAKSVIRALRVPMPQWWDGLDAIEAPCLVLVGHADGLFTMRRRLLADRLVSSRVEIVGVGHRVHADYPEAFIAAIAPFLNAGLSCSDQISSVRAVKSEPIKERCSAK